MIRQPILCDECGQHKEPRLIARTTKDPLGNSLPSDVMICLSCYDAVKVCQTCGEEKSIFAFSRNQRSIAGKRQRRPDCIDCRRITKTPINKAQADEFRKHNPPPAKGKKFTCPICRITRKIVKVGDVVLDHDHKNGKARGYLCRKCNTAIGTLYDDRDILLRAIEWVGKSQK